MKKQLVKFICTLYNKNSYFEIIIRKKDLR